MSDETENEHDDAPHANTDPPPPESHGFLEQFGAFAHSSFEELKGVVEQGIQTAERMVLIKVALKLLVLSMHDVREEDINPEMREELEMLLLELNSLPILHQS